MSDGFLGRWSRRKLDAKEGKPLADEPVPAAPPAGVRTEEPVTATAPMAPEAGGQDAAAPAKEAAPPTLEDAEALGPGSDFSRFTRRNVPPEVKNAAMKKLFADPRFNVMDGLDVYVDDYSRPDPITPAQIRQLAGARFLRLFDEDPADADEGPPSDARDDADNPTGQSVAHCDPAAPVAPEPSPHANPDLRLQQDHAAPGEDPGRGAG